MKKTIPPFLMNTLSSALVITLMSLLGVSVVQAQETAQLEEVIVTARKIMESVQDVPLAVSVFSGETINNLVMRDIREMEGFIPNLVIDSVSVAPDSASIYVRGVGTQEVERSFDPAVGVVIDGVALSYTNGSMVNTFDFATLEVLRGPQGTLFGRNTTGGVINVTRTRPTGEPGLRYEITAGSDDRIDLKAVLNFPIVKDVLAGKLGYASQKDGGSKKNLFNGDQVGDFDNQEITATVLYTPNDSFEALFTYTNYEDQNDGVPLQTIAQMPDLTCILGFCGGGPLDVVNQDFLNAIDFELDAFSLQMDWEFSLGTVTSVIGYRETDESVPTDFDGTPVPIFHTIRDQQSEQTSAEVRFATNADFSEKVDFVAGIYWLKDDYQLEQHTAILELLGPDPTGAGAVFQNPHTDHERVTWSIFGETHISFAEDWTLTLGGRYTQEEKEISANNFLAFGTPTGFFPIGAVMAEEDWSEFTPKVGVDYRLDDNVLLYASYAEGFRSGGFNGRNYTPADIGPYDPEYVKQFELGMKGDFLEQTLRVNLAAFLTDYDNKQEEIIQPDDFGGTVTIVKNAATVAIWGIEGELTWMASENLVINANFGHLDAEYDKYVADLNGDGVATDNSDLSLRRVPKWTGGINGVYTRDIGSGLLRAFLGYRYTDEYWVEVSNDPRGLLDSRGVVDAFISYEWEWGDGRIVKVTAFGRDLTDERAFSAAVVIPGFFSFAAVSGGEQYGIQLSGSF